MAVNTSLKPIDPKSFDYAKARHLLNRAGFGGPPSQVRALVQMGLDEAVDHLVDFEKVDHSDLVEAKYDKDIMRPLTPDERRMIRLGKDGDDQEARDRARMEFLRRMAEDRGQMNRLELWWLARMIATPRPLEEKLTLLWHGHFATNHRTIHDSYLMFKQVDFYRQNAAGSFADLARGIVRDPAMIKFLNNDSNRKDHPNENLARELMELFTLGEGNYTEEDIKEGARALTGYGVEDNDFQLRKQMHDAGFKTILGQRGTFNGDEFVDILLQRPECPIWVSYKLYKHFVGDIDDKENLDPSVKAVVQQLARGLLDAKYQLKPLLKSLFKSQHFYDSAVMGNLIKSPVQLVVGSARALDTPSRNINILSDAAGFMGQKLFEPPSVAGWDGGKGWINTSTLFIRQNLTAYLITGKLPGSGDWNRSQMDYDPRFLIADMSSPTPDAITDRLCEALLASPPLPERRNQLAGFLKQRKGPVSQDAMIAAVMLVTAMPEYQLC